MKILVVDCGSKKTKYIEECVDQEVDFQTVPLSEISTLENYNDFCGVVVSGAPILVTEIDPSPYLQKFDRLIQSRLPILGICFGHQLLGMSFGAQPSRMKEDRDWQTIEILEESPLFAKLGDTIEMMEDHCECISIPTGFKLVASSDACINEAMEHRHLPYFGVQFHPEVSGNHGAELIRNFVLLCIKKAAN